MCIWEWLHWAFSVSSSIVGRWSECWGTGYPQFSDASNIRKCPRCPNTSIFSIHQPPTQMWDFYLTSKLYQNSTHLYFAWTEEPTSISTRTKPHSVLASNQVTPNLTRVVPHVPNDLDKYWRVVLPLPWLSVTGSFSTAAKGWIYIRRKPWLVCLKAKACHVLWFIEVSFSCLSEHQKAACP